MRSLFFFSSLFILLLYSKILAQNSFSFSELKYLINGKDLGSNEVPIYENINVSVSGLKGYIVDDGDVELGMEVVITDGNSNRILYSPDMLEDIKLVEEEVAQIQFDIDLNEDFLFGEEYFIKIKIWDKRTDKSFSKHSSFLVTESLRNQNAYLDVRRLKVGGYKFYLNSHRLYQTNFIRKGNELVTDIFFKDFNAEKGEEVIVKTEIIDEQNSKSFPLQNEYVIKDKTEDLKSLFVRVMIDEQTLIPGNTYIFNLQFHNAARNQKLDMKLTFVLLTEDWKVNAEKTGGVDLEVFKNKESAKPNSILEIGDRLDFNFNGVTPKLNSDFGFGKIGGQIEIKDAQGKVVWRSIDVFKKLGPFALESKTSLLFDYLIQSDLNLGSKYSAEITVWDKYSSAFFVKKFPFKTAKTKEFPFGLQENLNLKCKFMDSKVNPVSVYVRRNGYKYLEQSLNPLDEIEVVSSIELDENFSSGAVVRNIELYDNEDQLLTHDEEVLENFRSGEIIANLVIPEIGIDYNKNYRLVIYLQDGELELMKVEYIFFIVQ